MYNKKPSVVFITIDALRIDELGVFGYQRPTSPFLDQFTAEGINFKNHFSNSSQSPPGFFSMFASQYPSARNDWTTTDGNFEFISEVFQKNGYYTAGFATAPYISNFFGYDRGFDEFFQMGPVEEIDPVKRAALSALPKGWIAPLKSFIKNTIIGKILNRVRYAFLPQHAYAGAEAVNKKILGFLESYQGTKPLFLWIHYMDVHNPFLPAQEDMKAVGGTLSCFRIARLNRKHLQLTRFDPFEDVLHMTHRELSDLRICYDAKLRYLDNKIKELFAMFANHGLGKEHTITAITADHGEAFGEHFGIGHTERLYDELLHVPFIIRVPEYPARDIVSLTNAVDILPTLAGLAGVSYRKNRVRGMNVLDETFVNREYVVSHVAPNVGGMLANVDFARSTFAVRTDTWKFIKDFGRKREELYNLADDPLELKNIASENNPIREELSRVLDSHIAECNAIR
ncbi:MAG: sulfatase-like hydrolase/transferase [Patescibacteria group bacterium]|nr:sulfatase-like hydrolase/transferase [Patescibacteria group bacterium]